MPLSTTAGRAGGGRTRVPPTLSHSPIPGAGASPVLPPALPQPPSAPGGSAVSRPPHPARGDLIAISISASIGFLLGLSFYVS